MTLRIAALLALALTAGCRSSYCERTCAEIKPQLIRDFAVPESSLNCSAQKWLESDDCQSCQQLLEHDYGVRFAAPCSPTGHGFLEPL